MKGFKGVRKQKGLAILDILTWMVVVATLLIVFAAGNDKVNTFYKGLRLSWQAADVQQAVTEWGGQSASYSSVTMALIKDYLPKDIGTGSGTNVFGGNITVAVGAQPYEYKVTFTGVPNTVGLRSIGKFDNATYDSGTEVFVITYAG